MYYLIWSIISRLYLFLHIKGILIQIKLENATIREFWIVSKCIIKLFYKTWVSFYQIQSQFVLIMYHYFSNFVNPLIKNAKIVGVGLLLPRGILSYVY